MCKYNCMKAIPYHGFRVEFCIGSVGRYKDHPNVLECEEGTLAEEHNSYQSRHISFVKLFDTRV